MKEEEKSIDIAHENPFAGAQPSKTQESREWKIGVTKPA